MSNLENMTAILPIDNFMEKPFPFTDVTLHLSSEAILFLTGTTKGRLNLYYYLFILHSMTIGRKSELVRGIRVDTATCQCSLSVSSLEQAWGIKRKQGRNLLDKMEQLNLIRRSSDFVTSIVDVISVSSGHADGEAYSNPNYILRPRNRQFSTFVSETDRSTQRVEQTAPPTDRSEKSQETIPASSELTSQPTAEKNPQTALNVEESQ